MQLLLQFYTDSFETLEDVNIIWIYSKTCLKRPLSKRPNLVFKTDYRLMQVKSIAECSKGSILQSFGPSLSYHLALRPLFCLFFEWPLKTGFTIILKLFLSLFPQLNLVIFTTKVNIY